MISKIKKEITFIFLLITIFVSCISCSSKAITGKYRTNFNTYGMFSKSLSLDCDNKAIMNFSGDIMQNNNSYGVWKRDNDTLVLFFDSIVNKNNKYKGEIKFLVKGNRIEYMPFPISKYRELVKHANENKEIKIPSYRKVKKITSKSLKNFTGKTGHQYFKKIESIECIK